MKNKTTNGKNGFTLIELIVVIALISITLFVAFPRFQRAFTDPTRAVSKWLLWKIPELKQEAVAEKHGISLHIDLGGNKLWVTHDDMNEAETAIAAENAYSLPEGIRLLDVEFSDSRIVSTGIAQIWFYPKGYSDRAVIHLQADDDQTLSYVIEPFLSKAKLVASHVGFTEN